jgi:nitrous oxide reductase accessory protein NosL
MAEVTYVSRVSIERVKGPLRRAVLPAESEPVWFSTHSEVSEHYGVRPEDVEQRATTLDYVVAAAGG